MSAWKWVNLILSGVILILAIWTILQFSVLVWQKKTEKNMARFKHLAIRFGGLVLLCILLQVINYIVRYRFYMGLL
jgi:dolichyl-phosphate-mannose--protein O-mannosyl transferase